MPEANLTEKVSVNINSSTLSAIDLLVDQGYFSNRSDFINQAIRQSIDQKQPVIERAIQQKKQAGAENDIWFFGVYHLEQAFLERMRAEGRTIRIKGYGVLLIPADCTEELLAAVVECIEVRGAVRGSERLKKHYQVK
jgi:Arc/MetJ-type ribon-helix-helix transcriptional regulator